MVSVQNNSYGFIVMNLSKEKHILKTLSTPPFLKTIKNIPPDCIDPGGVVCV